MGDKITARTMMEKINFRYFAIFPSGIRISIKVIDNITMKMSFTHSVTVLMRCLPD